MIETQRAFKFDMLDTMGDEIKLSVQEGTDDIAAVYFTQLSTNTTIQMNLDAKRVRAMIAAFQQALHWMVEDMSE